MAAIAADVLTDVLNDRSSPYAEVRSCWLPIDDLQSLHNGDMQLHVCIAELLITLQHAG